MSIVCHQRIVQVVPQPEENPLSVLYTSQASPAAPWLVALLFPFLLFASPSTWAASAQPVSQEDLLATIRDYAEGVEKGDRVAAGQRDFVCLFQMAQQQLLTTGEFPDGPHVTRATARRSVRPRARGTNRLVQHVLCAGASNLVLEIGRRCRRRRPWRARKKPPANFSALAGPVWTWATSFPT